MYFCYFYRASILVLQLALIPTKIHPWLELNDGRSVCIKRDDETGSALSGNKVTLFADYIRKNGRIRIFNQINTACVFSGSEARVLNGRRT